MSYVSKAIDMSLILMLVCKVPITQNHCHTYILPKNDVVPAVALWQWCGNLALNQWRQLSYFWQTTLATHLRAALLWKLSTFSPKVTVHKLRFLCTKEQGVP